MNGLSAAGGANIGRGRGFPPAPPSSLKGGEPMIVSDRRDARAALVLLDQIAARHGDELLDEEFDEVAGAQTLLNTWLEKNAGGAS
jgi:hypothetical protein